jgi:hypothetical protein
MMARTSYLWTASDPAYGAVNGEDLLPDLAIGRLPVATVDDVRVAVEKILAYEAAPSSRAVVLVADNRDETADFEADADEIASHVLASRSPGKIYVSRLGANAARQAIRDAFDRGPFLLSYVGHGGIDLWASENVFNASDASALAPQREGERLPLSRRVDSA